MANTSDTYAAQSPQFQPLTFGMILDRTINLYIHNFLLLFGIMLIPQGLNYANEIVFAKSLEWSMRAATAVYIAVYFLIYLLTVAVGTGAATVAISSRYLGREISVAAAYRQALRKIGSIMGAGFVAGILIVLVLVGGVTGSIILFSLLTTAVAGFSQLLVYLSVPLLISGVVILTGRMAVSYSLITPAIILEDCSAGKSRKRSRFLTKGARWRILGIFMLYLIVVLTVSYGSLFLVNLITGTDPSILLTGKLTYIHHLVSAPLQFLIAPIPAILIVLIYYNQRMRKEGFDLVLLAEALVEQ